MKTFAMALMAATALAPAAAIAQTATQPNAAGNSAANTQMNNAQMNQMRPMAVSQIRGKDVYNARGEDLGEIERIILGQGDQAYGVIKFGEILGLGGEARIVPLSRVTMRDDRALLNMTEAELRALPAYRTGLAGYRDAEPTYQVRFQTAANTGANQTQQTADGARIVVQRQAPTIRVDQASPQVQVTPAQPQVTVQQARPEITVRQPAPQVTVNIPQPEIVVRMPRPDVNVAMTQPQVEVTQPRPQVQVVQREEPQVQVQPAQPQVTVQRQANAQPNVQVQQPDQQPVVRYERAEPKVTVNQAEGQPTVRFEQADAQGMNANQRTAAASTTETDRTATTRAVGSGTQAIRIAELENMNLYNANGQQLGDIERIVSTMDGKMFVIIGHGGFLELGEKQVAVPLENVMMQNNRLMVRGLTEDQIEAMPVFTFNERTYRELNDNQTAPIARS